MGDQADGGDNLLSDGQREDLTAQLQRLNDNIEKQFGLIDQQRERDRTAARRRWLIVVLVALLIAGGNVRVEMIRNEQRARDRSQQEAEAKRLAVAQTEEDRLACVRTNLARREIRSGFDTTLEAVVQIAREDQKEAARLLADQVHEQLAQSLPTRRCTDGPAQYANCEDAALDGVTPLDVFDPGYSEALDGDGDGIACE